MVDDFSNYMVDMDRHFIVIRNVSCHKCSQCGEVSYSGEVAASLEEFVAKMKEVFAEVKKKRNNCWLIKIINFLFID